MTIFNANAFGPFALSATVGLGALGGLGCGGSTGRASFPSGADSLSTPAWAHSAATFLTPITELSKIASSGDQCVVDFDLTVSLDKYRGNGPACHAYATARLMAADRLQPLLTAIRLADDKLKTLAPKVPQDPAHPLCQFQETSTGAVTIALQFSDQGSCDALQGAVENREEAKRRYAKALVEGVNDLKARAARTMTSDPFAGFPPFAK